MARLVWLTAPVQPERLLGLENIPRNLEVYGLRSPAYMAWYPFALSAAEPFGAFAVMPIFLLAPLVVFARRQPGWLRLSLGSVRPAG